MGFTTGGQPGNKRALNRLGVGDICFLSGLLQISTISIVIEYTMGLDLLGLTTVMNGMTLPSI